MKLTFLVLFSAFVIATDAETFNFQNPGTYKFIKDNNTCMSSRVVFELYGAGGGGSCGGHRHDSAGGGGGGYVKIELPLNHKTVYNITVGRGGAGGQDGGDTIVKSSDGTVIIAKGGKGSFGNIAKGGEVHVSSTSTHPTYFSAKGTDGHNSQIVRLDHSRMVFKSGHGGSSYKQTNSLLENGCYIRIIVDYDKIHSNRYSFEINEFTKRVGYGGGGGCWTLEADSNSCLITGNKSFDFYSRGTSGSAGQVTISSY